MVVAAITAVFVGVWFGEDITAVVRPDGLAVLAGWAVVGAVLTPGNRGSRAMGAVMLLTASGAGFVTGRYEATTAFHECTARVEAVREALAAAKAERGEWPATLDETVMDQIPCQRLLRKRVLEYRRTQSGYSIEIENWSRVYRASEKGGFGAE